MLMITLPLLFCHFFFDMLAPPAIFH